MGGLPECRPRPGSGNPAVWVYRHICQEVSPWNVRFAEVAAERDYAAWAWEAEWDAGGRVRRVHAGVGEGPAVSKTARARVVRFQA